MNTDFSRRQALASMLAGLGASLAAGCDPTPAPTTEPVDSDQPVQINHDRMAAALTVVFEGTPFEDDARALPGRLQDDIDRLLDKGMVSTAQLIAQSEAILLTPMFEAQAVVKSTPDLDTDPQPLALAYANGLAGFLENRDSLIALLSNAVTEVTAELGGDVVSVEDQASGVATVLDYETRTRKWLHESGLSGEAWANTALRGAQTARAGGAEARSLSGLALDVEEKALDVGEFGDDLSLLLVGLATSDPPPPVDVDDVCFVFSILGILLAPFSLGASLSKEGADALKEVANYAFGQGMTVSDMIADGAAGANPCETIYLAIQLTLQFIAFVLSVLALAMVLSAVAGGMLGAALLMAEGVVAVAGAVCAFDKAMTLLADWRQTCA